MLLDDPVQCRWHWPTCTELRVNSIPYRVYARSSSTKLGINQRDEAANIGVLCSTSSERGSGDWGGKLGPGWEGKG
jgi:hypothetical protein